MIDEIDLDAVAVEGGLSPWTPGSVLRCGARFKETLRVFDEGAELAEGDMPHDWCGAKPLPDNVVRLGSRN